MNYKSKRLKAKLTPYTVAKELGVDFNKYLLIEKGKIALEGELIDKFMKITEPKNARTIKFNRFQRIADLKKKSKNGELKKMMTNRGYNGTKLAEAMGISDSEISRCMNYGKNSKKCNEDNLERVFDFLNSPINTYIEEKGNVKKVQENNLNLLTKEEKEKYKQLIEKYDLKRADIAKEIGYKTSSISNLLSKSSYASPKCKERFVEYMKKYEAMEESEETKEVLENTPQIEIPQEVPTPEESPIEETQTTIPEEEKRLNFTEMFELVKENIKLKQKVSDLEIQLARYNKLIDRL